MKKFQFGFAQILNEKKYLLKIANILSNILNWYFQQDLSQKPLLSDIWLI